MSVIKGKNVILYWYVDSLWQPLACYRNVAFSTNSELGETSTDTTGTSRTYRGLRHTWNVSCDGLCSFDNNLAVSTMRALQKAFTEILISFTAEDDNGLIETYQGNAIITVIDTNAAFNDVYKYSLQATGTGPYSITDDPIDPNIPGGSFMIYNYDGTGTEGGGTVLPPIPDLDGKVIKLAVRDGIYYRKVDASPSSKQFTAVATIITFSDVDPAIQSGEMIDIIYTNN